MDNKMNNINLVKDSDTKEIVLDNFGSNSNLDIGLNNLEVIDLDNNLNTSSLPKPNLTVHNSSDIITIPEINSTKKGSSLELGLDLLANQNKKKTPSSENISLNNFSSQQNQSQQSSQFHAPRPVTDTHSSFHQPQPSEHIPSQSPPQPQPQPQRPPLQTPTQGMSINLDNLETINLDNDNTSQIPQQPSNPDIQADNISTEPPKEKPINTMTSDEIMKEKTEILSFFDRLEKEESES